MLLISTEGQMQNERQQTEVNTGSADGADESMLVDKPGEQSTP